MVGTSGMPTGDSPKRNAPAGVIRQFWRRIAIARHADFMQKNQSRFSFGEAISWHSPYTNYTSQFAWHISYIRATIFNIMPKPITQTGIQLGSQGRLVIPAPLRRSLGFASGDHLIARIEEGRLVLEKAGMIKQRLKNRFARLPSTTSLAEELIAERREAAKREANE